MEVGIGTGIGAVGGALVTMVVTKLLNRTATSIENLPKLEWKVEELEKKCSELEKICDIQDRQLLAFWRELSKSKTWIDDTIKIAKIKGIDLTEPRWGPEP